MLEKQIDILKASSEVKIGEATFTVYELDFVAAMELAQRLTNCAEDLIGASAVAGGVAAVASGEIEADKASEFGKRIVIALTKHLPLAHFVLTKGLRADEENVSGLPTSAAVRLLAEIIRLTINEDLLGNLAMLAQTVTGLLKPVKPASS